MREIGSEFWLETTLKKVNSNKIPEWLEIGEDKQLLYSGRTAIDYVLNDIKGAKSVYFPSYCCHSMLQPFLDRNIKVYYYDVICNENGLKYILDEDIECDIFFAMSYFGYSSTIMDTNIKIFANKGAIVIEDITHRLLSEENHCRDSSYLVASLRKWFELPSGGIAVKLVGTFSGSELSKPTKAVFNKITAMKTKGKYLNNNGEDIKKKEFLELFKIFNDDLKLNYKSLKIDDLSKGILTTIDIEKVRRIRKENSMVLLKELKNIRQLKLLIPTIDLKKDCLLFFPVKIDPLKREKIREKMAFNKIYLPIHWPQPNEIKLNLESQKLYKEELSLICDQRYSCEEMGVIIKKIKEILE